ncbi:MAG: hypothetical protein A3E83_05095 [Gammaproteobacteria bacterium RIFCSPHIGHO2_12_FULL_41_20]|nr:MAG: hypothetical protein A3E83_05095 [Gammaproteobacteria bacterium RIFCSPHIGHO2_12_FULL_41_20]
MIDRYHVIKDPVHGTMQFTAVEDHWVKPFMDSPTFQRLRYIKQLGMGDLIFPGAVHTRFNHCLGACYVASQIAQKIGLAEEERQLVMIAALLHDIGHGPFSHAFEGVFYQKLVRHEDWTPYFLAEYRDADFFTHYNRLNPRHHISTDKFAIIEKMICHQPIDNHVLADVVSSQLDADRLDYLLRDSHFCGVAYGEFDFRWMLHCLAIVESPEGERLGITYKGIGVVEHYLMARRLMTRNIYHGQKKLALEFFLIKWFALLAESLDKEAVFSAVRDTRLGLFLQEVNYFNRRAQTSRDHEKLKQEFLEKNYKNYKSLNDYDVLVVMQQLAQLDNSHPVVELARRIQHRQMPKIIRLDHVDLAQVEKKLAAFKKEHKHHFQDWQLSFVQTPHRVYSGEDDPILVMNERGEVRPLEDISFMIHAISDKLEHTAFLCIDKAIAQDARVLFFLSGEAHQVD